MFYTTFENLCRDNHIAPSAVARKLGMSSSAPGRWKTGSLPDLGTAQKIAEYFGVSIDFLVKGESARESITATGRSVVLHGNTGNNTVAQGNIQTAGDQLSDMEKELLRIFRKMDMRTKNAAMSYFYDLEDQIKEV